MKHKLFLLSVAGLLASCAPNQIMLSDAYVGPNKPKPVSRLVLIREGFKPLGYARDGQITAGTVTN